MKAEKLWILNSQATHRSIIEMKDNQLIAHDQKTLNANGYSLSAMTGLMKDRQGRLWFVNDNHETPAIVCYQPETDEVKMFSKPFTNQDGAEINLYYIRCIKEDLEHNLWIANRPGTFLHHSANPG